MDGTLSQTIHGNVLLKLRGVDETLKVRSIIEGLKKGLKLAVIHESLYASIVIERLASM